MSCRECGQNYQDTKSMLIHAAIKHKVLGANFQTKKRNRVINQSLEVQGPLKGHKVISDAPSKPKKKLRKTSRDLRSMAGAVTIVSLQLFLQIALAGRRNWDFIFILSLRALDN